MSTYGSFIGRVCLVFGFLEIYCNGNSIRILNRFHGHDYTGTKIIDPPSDGRLQKNIYFDSSEDEIEHSNLSIHLPLDGLKKDTEESSSSWKIPLEYSSNSIDKDSERNNSESMLMTTFKDFFLNDLFPTQTDNGNKFSFERNGIDGLENFCVDNAHALCLGRLYGTDSTREFALRLQSRGQMKSNEYGGLPNIVEVRKNAEYFSIQCDHNHTNTLCMNDSDWYATGHINSNFHPGRLFYTELFLKEHNYIAEVLGNQNPTWDDDQIFQVARIMMIHLFTKIIVEEYLPSALRKKYKMNYFRYYDPNELRKIQYHIHTNPFFLEFHNFYCSWISLVTGNIEFESGEMRRFNEFLWKPSEYKTIGVEKFLRAFYRTNVTGSEAPSIPKDFISISREFILNRSLRSLKSMIDTGRSLHQFRSYNVYREYLDLPPLQSFDDFHISPEIRKALQEFYETVNDVDFFVGIALEQCSNHGKVSLSETMEVAVASFAISTTINFETIQNPYFYSMELLTSYGIHYIQNTDLLDIFERHIDAGSLPLCPSSRILGGCSMSYETYFPQGENKFSKIDYIVALKGLLYIQYSLLSIWCGVLVMRKKSNPIPLLHREQNSSDKKSLDRICLIAYVAFTSLYMYMGIAVLFYEDAGNTMGVFFLLENMLYSMHFFGWFKSIFSYFSMHLLHVIWHIMLLISIVSQPAPLYQQNFILDITISFELGLFITLGLQNTFIKSPCSSSKFLKILLLLSQVLQMIFGLIVFIILFSKLRYHTDSLITFFASVSLACFRAVKSVRYFDQALDLFNQNKKL